MVKKVSIFLIIGFIVTLFLAQFDSWTHKKLIYMCQKIAHDTLGCQSDFVIESLNFFSPSIVISQVSMMGHDGTWHWKCKRCEMYSSWIQLLFKGILERHMIVDGFECLSSIHHGRCTIEPHIIALTSNSLLPIPSELKSIVFRNACFSLCDEQKEATLSLFFNSSSLKVADRFRSMMSIYDGTARYKEESYITDIVTDISSIVWYDNDRYMYSMNGSGLLRLTHMADQGTCYVAGTLESGHGRFSLRNAYNSFTVDPIIITEREIRVDSTMPVSYLMRCIKADMIAEPVTGTVNSHVRIDKNNEKMDGQIVVQDCSAAQIHFCDAAKITFSRKEQLSKIRMNIARRNEECKGAGYWNEELQQGHFEFHNSTHLSSTIAPHWKIMPKNLLCTVWIYHKELVGLYKTDVTNVLSNGHHNLSGGFSYDKEIVSIASLLDTTELFSQVKLLPQLSFLQAAVYDKNKKNLLSLLKTEQDEYVHGTVSFAFIRTFINTFFHYDMQGEGIFNVNTKILPEGFAVDVVSEDTIIRLPETYNFIDGIQTHITYNMNKRIMEIEDSSLSLYTGNIQCARATAYFNEKGKLVFAHVPVLLDHCLLNKEKDLFAMVSGYALATYTDVKGAHVGGNIIIDRAQLKENLFSTVVQKKLFGYANSTFSTSRIPITCDLKVETKSPIRVDTAFLQTNAKVNIKIQNNITEPNISGAITLQSGNLIFPYKPLLIKKGVLTFSPDRSFDPMIDLVAHNKIKNYDISLQVAGSLLNHHIMLDSIPPLAEDQIMTLLLVGSQESSLNNMIPALIVQNLKNLIFSHNQSTFLEKYFAPILRPLNINLVPSFADQTGRGGLRGMLEVTINDRIRAILQKNFSLTEDTRVELEFSLSDDITLRGIRDERRDMGGEVEMRWKF